MSHSHLGTIVKFKAVGTTVDTSIAPKYGFLYKLIKQPGADLEFFILSPTNQFNDQVEKNYLQGTFFYKIDEDSIQRCIVLCPMPQDILPLENSLLLQVKMDFPVDKKSGRTACSLAWHAFNNGSQLLSYSKDGVIYSPIYCLPDGNNPNILPYLAYCKGIDVREVNREWAHDDNPIYENDLKIKEFMIHNDTKLAGSETPTQSPRPNNTDG